jgi:cyanophycinase-like exopeptidase
MNMALGRIAFLGSGETSLAGGRIFESLARDINEPLRIALIETPAGFELNSAQVVGRVGDFMTTRLQNYKPVVDVIAARKKNSAYSPDDPEIVKPLLHANMIFMGPGSPTYAIRQLMGTLTWDVIRARHRLGATLIFASAATISIGAHALPVYEIYKVGQDVHVVDGLNLFADFGLHVSFIPHWNNADGGVDLDTSRCFIGMERFAEWCGLVPSENETIGLDEHTGIIIDFESGLCEVSGVSSVSLVRECNPEMYASGSKFAINELGEFRLPDPIEKDIPAEVWEMCVNAPPLEEDHPSAEVIALVEQRVIARASKNWGESDKLRQEIAALGWTVQDSKDGYKLLKNE